MLPWNTLSDKVALIFDFQNWIPFWSGGVVPPNLIGHFWSLGVEENFYLLWPWLIWLLPERFYLRTCLIGIFCSLSIRVTAIALYGAPVLPYLLTVRGVDSLLVGCALAVVSFRKGQVSKRIITWMLTLGVSVLLVIYGIGGKSRTELVFTIGILAYAQVFGSLVASAQYPTLFFTRLMSLTWLRNVGTYSYGMYVYHVPLFQVERHFFFERGLQLPETVTNRLIFLIVVTITTYLVAWLSFSVLEQPILRLKKYFVAYVRPKPIAMRHSN